MVLGVGVGSDKPWPPTIAVMAKEAGNDMWVMTTYGAFSVVARDPKHTPAGDDRTMVIRSRQKIWLTELRKRAMPDLGPAVHYAGADYQYHCAVTPEALALGMARIALDAGSYRNFKSATASPKFGLKSPKLRGQLVSAYHKIWSTLLDAGDGTSLYDHKWGSGKAGGLHLADADDGTIDMCARLGHYFNGTDGKCIDCGTPQPADSTGKQGGKPSKAEVDAWWAERGGRKAPAKSATVKS